MMSRQGQGRGHEDCADGSMYSRRKKRLEIDLQPFRSSDAQASYLIGGVPSALPKMASICTSASMGSAAVPTARKAGVPVK